MVVDQWERLWAQSHLYVDRLKAIEVLFNGRDELVVLLGELEQQFVEQGAVSSNVAALRNSQQQLKVSG